MSFWPFGKKPEHRQGPVEPPPFVRPPKPDSSIAVPTTIRAEPQIHPHVDEPDDENWDENDEEDQEDEGIEFPIFKVPTTVKTMRIPETTAQLALSLGCATPELVYARLSQLFVDEHIAVAETEAVAEWLTDRIDYIESDGWYWRPLRPCDVLNEQSWGHDDYDSSDWKSRLYDLPIPARVLERVAKIVAILGTNVRFYVSDFAEFDYDHDNDRADIFLMVFPANFTPDQNEEDDDFYYVIDTWSKPSY